MTVIVSALRAGSEVLSSSLSLDADLLLSGPRISYLCVSESLPRLLAPRSQEASTLMVVLMSESLQE